MTSLASFLIEEEINMASLIKEKYVRCVWPDFPLPLGKNGNDLVNYFKETYDINIEYLEQTKTSVDYGAKGGRIDQIFNVKEDSIDKFAQIKTSIGAEYVTDIVKNNEHHMYKERIFLMYFQRAENDLLRAGEITERNKYQLIGK